MFRIIIKSIILVCIILSIYFIVNPSACSNLINGRAVNIREKLPVQESSNQQSEFFVPAGDQPLRSDEKPAKVSSAEASTVPAQTVVGAQQEQTEQQGKSAQPVVSSAQPATSQPEDPSSQPGSSMPTAQLQEHPQAEVDYAIASRYVELEKQYLAQHKDAKNVAKDISYIVMDDFELTPAEWEAFLQRASASNLFEVIRRQQK